MVEATDELRERLWDWADQILDLWNIEDTNPPSLTEGFADLLLPALAAVVAEARTEGAIAELEAAADLILAPSEHLRDSATCRDIAYDLHERAAALRGVGNQKVGVTVDDLALDEMDGNQKVEPRWSANRLEEVLREGLPDQNAEPWKCQKCGSGQWVGHRYGPAHEGFQRNAQCVPCGHVQQLPADQKGTEQ